MEHGVKNIAELGMRIADLEARRQETEEAQSKN
jgi:hypothetical protein